jgi:secreted Zn-dependent insulinase-like peptidase
MRTDKQLGYLVGTGYAPLNSRAGIAMYVQSPTSNSDELLAHHEQFTQQYHQRIQSLCDQDWHQIKMGLMTQIMEKDKNLRVRSQRYWLSLNNQDFKFNMQARLQTSLSHLTQSTLADFCQQLFSENSVKTVLLSAQNEKVTQTTTKLSKSL